MAAIFAVIIMAESGERVYWQRAGDLPVKEVVPELQKALAEATTCLLEAPPGAGKSTLVPLALQEELWLSGQKILMLEPRRLAARAVATRMAWLVGEDVGETVGYRVRFESKVSGKTRIEVLTEGILTRMLQDDNALEGVGLVIFDEFHERSLQADLALALARECQSVLRPDLRILIMSATLDVAGLASVLEGSRVVRSAGRMYPVFIQYRPSSADAPVWGSVASAVREALRVHPSGDVLAFLPGQGEIERCRKILEETVQDALILPLYGDLSAEAQQQALMPVPGRRKVVLATSIAETSLTIEGVAIVVDSGLARVPKFDPRSGFTRLETQPISQDAATQRAGRAGRLGPGTAYRLWAEGKQAHLPLHRTPEILEADLAPMMLELTAWGHSDAEGLSWMTPPPRGHVAQALTLLESLGAIQERKITHAGRQMLRLPTHPRLAHLLLEGAARGWNRLAAQTAALLEERDPMAATGRGTADLTERLEMLARRRGPDRNALERIDRLAREWERSLSRIAVNTTLNPVAEGHTDPYAVGLLVAAAYPERVARQRQGASYRLVNGRGARLPDQDPLDREQWLAVAHLDGGVGEGRIFLAAPLDREALLPLATPADTIRWDDASGRIVAQREWRLGALVVDSKPLQEVLESDKATVICDAVRRNGLAMLGFGEAEREWQGRVLSLGIWNPDEGWPHVSDARLLETLETWLGPYLGPVGKADDLSRLPLPGLLGSLLPWDLSQQLNERAPLTIAVPTGSHIRLQYSQDGDLPILAVRLQEMFGQEDTPRIDRNRRPILLHLLSPGHKPVQVTQSLASFWANTYAEVRKDLRGRYPKHSWPEDPMEAKAIRGTKKQNGMK